MKRKELTKTFMMISNWKNPSQFDHFKWLCTVSMYTNVSALSDTQENVYFH